MSHLNHLQEKFIIILNKIKNDNLISGLEDLKKYVISNRKDFKPYAYDYFLDFIGDLDGSLYKLDSSGDDFEGMSQFYINQIKQPNSSMRDIWRAASSIIWEMCTYCTDEVCPRCKADTLKIVQDLEHKMYKSCETCFYTELDGKSVTKPDDLLPVPFKNL